MRPSKKHKGQLHALKPLPSFWLLPLCAMLHPTHAEGSSPHVHAMHHVPYTPAPSLSPSSTPSSCISMSPALSAASLPDDGVESASSSKSGRKRFRSPSGDWQRVVLTLHTSACVLTVAHLHCHGAMKSGANKLLPTPFFSIVPSCVHMAGTAAPQPNTASKNSNALLTLLVHHAGSTTPVLLRHHLEQKVVSWFKAISDAILLHHKPTALSVGPPTPPSQTRARATYTVNFAPNPQSRLTSEVLDDGNDDTGATKKEKGGTNEHFAAAVADRVAELEDIAAGLRRRLESALEDADYQRAVADDFREQNRRLRERTRELEIAAAAAAAAGNVDSSTERNGGDSTDAQQAKLHSNVLNVVREMADFVEEKGLGIANRWERVFDGLIQRLDTVGSNLGVLQADQHDSKRCESSQSLPGGVLNKNAPATQEKRLEILKDDSVAVTESESLLSRTEVAQLIAHETEMYKKEIERLKKESIPIEEVQDMIENPHSSQHFQSWLQKQRSNNAKMHAQYSRTAMEDAKHVMPAFHYSYTNNQFLTTNRPTADSASLSSASVISGNRQRWDSLTDSSSLISAAKSRDSCSSGSNHEANAKRERPRNPMGVGPDDDDVEDGNHEYAWKEELLDAILDSDGSILLAPHSETGSNKDASVSEAMKSPQIEPYKTHARSHHVSLQMAARDSPFLRANFNHFEDELEELLKWVDGLIKATKNYADAFLKMNDNSLNLVASLTSHRRLSVLGACATFSCGTSPTPPTSAQATRPLSIYGDSAVILNCGFLTLHGRARARAPPQAEDLNENLLFPLRHYLKEEIKELREHRRNHDRVTTNYDAALVKYAALPKNKESSALHEDSFVLFEAKKAFIHSNLNYADHVISFKNKMIYFFVQQLMLAMYTHMDYFENNYEVFHGMKPSIDKLKVMIEERKQSIPPQEEVLAYKNALEDEALNLARPKSMMTVDELQAFSALFSKQSSNGKPAQGSTQPLDSAPFSLPTSAIPLPQTEMEGYLFKKSEKKWIRRYFMIRKGAMFYVNTYPTGKTRGAVLSTDPITIANYSARQDFSEDRRFCFEVFGEKKSFKLQAESRNEMWEWINVIEAAKTVPQSTPKLSNGLSSKVLGQAKMDLEPASSRGSPQPLAETQEDPFGAEATNENLDESVSEGEEEEIASFELEEVGGDAAESEKPVAAFQDVTVVYPDKSFEARNIELHKLLKSVPPTDFLIDSFAIILQRQNLVQGKIYITQNRICFWSSIMGIVSVLVIHLKEITNVTRSRQGLYKCINIETTKRPHQFKSLLKDTGKVYAVIVGAWENVVKSPVRLNAQELFDKLSASSRKIEEKEAEKAKVKALSELEEANEGGAGSSSGLSKTEYDLPDTIPVPATNPTCECAEHPEHKDEDFTLPIPAKRAFDLLFGNSAQTTQMYEKFFAKRGLTNVVHEDWVEPATGQILGEAPAGAIASKVLNYTMPVNAPMGIIKSQALSGSAAFAADLAVALKEEANVINRNLGGPAGPSDSGGLNGSFGGEPSSSTSTTAAGGAESVLPFNLSNSFVAQWSIVALLGLSLLFNIVGLFRTGRADSKAELSIQESASCVRDELGAVDWRSEILRDGSGELVRKSVSAYLSTHYSWWDPRSCNASVVPPWRAQNDVRVPDSPVYNSAEGTEMFLRLRALHLAAAEARLEVWESLRWLDELERDVFWAGYYNWVADGVVLVGDRCRDMPKSVGWYLGGCEKVRGVLGELEQRQK
ncbi:SNF1-interacting protein [Entophlyctis luteolus]|nr:SNF1-interacting protein [Entophlyctis luteolus]